MTEQKEYRFDDWTLSGVPRQLAHRGQAVRLQELPLKLLEELLERPGELVTREHLIGRLWPKRVVDYDTALNAAVRRLRAALNDEADTPLYIQTLPRHGYRFIGALSLAAAAAPVKPPGRRITPWVVAGVVLLAGGAAAWWALSSREAPGSKTVAIDASAQEALERANFFLRRREPGDFERAQRDFQNAVARSPEFARAWAGLASVYWLRVAAGEIERADGIELVRTAARRALAIDPRLADAHLRLSNAAALEGNDADARAHMKVAMQFEPRNPLVLSFAASYDAIHGDLARAIELQSRAVQLDPASATTRYNLGAYQLMARNLPAAERAFRETLELSPQMHLYKLAHVLVLQGRFQEANTLVQDWNTSEVERAQVHALAYFGAGRRADADAALETLKKSASQTDPFAVAEVLAFRGDTDAAFEWLERVLAGDPVARLFLRTPRVPWEMRFSPLLGPLHDDPRWQAWVERLRSTSVSRPKI